MNLTVFWNFLLSACEPINILYVGRHTTMIKPKILGAVVRNLLAWATRRPLFLHPCPTGNKLECANHSRASQKHINILATGWLHKVILHNEHKRKLKSAFEAHAINNFLHKRDKKRNEQGTQLHSRGYFLNNTFLSRQ